MVRYLMHFSYIGHGFGGFQWQRGLPVKSVAGIINKSLNLVNSRINPDGEQQTLRLIGSSRTDRGVNALCNAGHINLNCPSYENFNPDDFTKLMNETLFELDENISILRTIKVPDTFHCRYHALSRTYLYRLCILNGDLIPQNHDGDEMARVLRPFPLFDDRRCMFISRPIDMDLVKEAGKLLHGVNDFRAFTTPKVRQMLESIEPDKWGPRSVKDMEVKVYSTSHFIADENVSEYYSGSYQMWNITFKSSSFIYRQVRRMTGIMLAVGFGHLGLKDVEKLLDESSHYSLGWTPPPPPPPPPTPSPVASASLLSTNSSSLSSSASFSSSSMPLITELPSSSESSSCSQKELPPLVPILRLKFKVPSGGLYLVNIEYPKEIMTGNAKEFVTGKEKVPSSDDSDVDID